MCADLGSLAVLQKYSPRLAGLLQLGFILHPVGMDDLGYGITVLGVVDCRSKEILPRQPPEAAMGLAPSFNGPGNCDRVDPVFRHRGDAVFRQKLDGKSARRPAARVQAIEFAGLCLPINEKQIAADRRYSWAR